MRRVYFYLLLVIALLCSCAPVSTSNSPSEFGKASLLISIKGTVSVKRDGWVDYQPIGFGALVYSTDLVKVNGKITLLCADAQTVKEFEGTGRNPCPLPSQNMVLIYDQMYFSSNSRGYLSANIPYILYPRSTTILEDRPYLQWHDTKASSYKVEIFDGPKPIWQDPAVRTNKLLYPKTAPALKSGRDYLLVITDNDTGKSSTDDPSKGLGFQIVDGAKAIEINKIREYILNMKSVDPAAQKLILALYYEQLSIGGRGIWSEASVLFSEASSNYISPSAHLRKGNVLVKMKLWDDAIKQYKTALEQALSLSDLESQADALAMLWRITGDQTQYDKALTLYTKIGAQNRINELKGKSP